MDEFDEVVERIRQALCDTTNVVRDERYPAPATINKRELHELTIVVNGRKFQINVQEQS